MSRDEFEKLIISIGFKLGFKQHYNDIYSYKEFGIYLYIDHYIFSYPSRSINIHSLDNLTPLHKEFKNELRSIKLKKLLSL